MDKVVMKINNRYIYGIIALILLGLIIYGGPTGKDKVYEMLTERVRAQADADIQVYKDLVLEKDAEIAIIEAKNNLLRDELEKYKQRQADAMEALVAAELEARDMQMDEVLLKMRELGYNPVVK
jgi:hypothetical protein